MQFEANRKTSDVLQHAAKLLSGENAPQGSIRAQLEQVVVVTAVHETDH